MLATEHDAHVAKDTESQGQEDLTRLLQAVDKAASQAGSRIAPLWPLTNFVAVNPLLGVAGQTLSASAHTMARAMGARLTMPRAYYASLLESGQIEDRDIAGAIAELAGELGIATTVERVRSEVLQADVPVERFKLPTVATLAARRDGTDWPALIQSTIGNWAAGFFDEGISAWSAAPTEASPWPSFRAVASIDRSAELLGMKNARQLFADMPTQPIELLATLVRRLNLPEAALAPYFHRLLADVAGWAAYARYQGWTRELRGEDGSAARQLLAVRAAWELALLQSFNGGALDKDFAHCRQQFIESDRTLWRALTATDQILQLAFERATQRRLSQDIEHTAALPEDNGRPDVQAAFCIDVRSERYRRALEAASLRVDTIGFAGFFGLPVELHEATDTHTARCPVLLEPGLGTVEQALDTGALRSSKRDARSLAGRWARLQRGGVSGFGFVEALGLGYLWKLASATFGNRHEGHACEHTRHYTLDAGLSEKISLAEGILRGMSLTENFARLVVFVGHGSHSTNNPYDSALQCGACGGHAGDVNARLAAQLLNDRFVRAGLVQHGIDIPTDTVFLSGLHNTTTDDITLLDTGSAPQDHQLLIQALQGELEEATLKVREERAGSLGETRDSTGHKRIVDRAGDWSQVRPEWGLAGCHAFIAAPRSRTRNLLLNGRSFLHEYRHGEDQGYRVLETILTAPLVVASWITLQYYGSTVDNRHFGSGDKTLHNVVSGIGVLEGVGGDLRSGLPMQSIHNGREFVHEPLRLTAVIEAPATAIDNIIGEHEALALLVDNGWIQMHAIDARGCLWRRPRGGGNWIRVINDSAHKRVQSEAA